MAPNVREPRFYRHHSFDLMLPSDEVLAQHVGAQINARSTCHEWPLSCVERVVFEGEIIRYCKTIRSPALEVEAYSALTSPLLVPYSIVAQLPDLDILLLDAFRGERLSLEVVEKAGISAFTNDLKNSLSTISGSRPVFVNLSTEEDVRKNMTTMVERLSRRFGAGTSSPIDSSLLSLADRCVANPEILDVFVQDVVYSNGDLSADNILVLGDEVRIIDWQFPRLTSFSVELVNLYTSLGIDPRLYLKAPVIVAWLLCKIRWFAECADVWLPDGGYDVEIAKLLGEIGKLTLRDS